MTKILYSTEILEEKLRQYETLQLLLNSNPPKNWRGHVNDWIVSELKKFTALTLPVIKNELRKRR